MKQTFNKYCDNQLCSAVAEALHPAKRMLHPKQTGKTARTVIDNTVGLRTKGNGYTFPLLDKGTPAFPLWKSRLVGLSYGRDSAGV